MTEDEPDSPAPPQEATPPLPPSALDDAIGRVVGLLGPGVRAAEVVTRLVEKGVVVPAWRRVTNGESRWPVTVGVATAIAIQLVLPGKVSFHPQWLLPAVEGAFVAALFVMNPGRLIQHKTSVRVVTILLIASVSIANVISAGRLITQLVEGRAEQKPAPLLLVGFAIWITNVIAFSLWYWELDRGGPSARAMAMTAHPDFLYPQMQNPEFAPPDWEPGYVDYLYLSFTNATAFSPTDVLPLTRWAKMAMLVQSIISLATVALVIARAVNILG